MRSSQNSAPAASASNQGVRDLPPALPPGKSNEPRRRNGLYNSGVQRRKPTAANAHVVQSGRYAA